MDKSFFEHYFNSFKNQNDEHESLQKNVLESWITIYGHNQTMIEELMEKIRNDLKEFWENQIEVTEERKQNIIKSIERNAKEAYNLEKSLGLPAKVDSMTCVGIPLVEHDEAIWQILCSYQAIKQNRIEKYTTLQNQEIELCASLGEKEQIITLYDDAPNLSCDVRGPRNDAPSEEEIVKAEERIMELKCKMGAMLDEFKTCKQQLRDILIECETVPFTLPEKFSFDQTTDEEFKHTKENLEWLKKCITQHLTNKEEVKTEIIHCKEEISKLWKKMLKHPEELEKLFRECSGYTNATVAKLTEILKKLKEERKMKLEDLILSHRTLLEELWTQCCYSEDQKSEFFAYKVDYYSEEVLNLHELEVEKLQYFYDENKRIFQLAKKHDELWERLLHLEELASQSDRLFSNRGGRLLQEERERKLIQKKVPAVKEELLSLLEAYKASHKTDFLYYGAPLIETFRIKEEEREKLKEIHKQQRLLKAEEPATKKRVCSPTRLGFGGECGYATVRTPNHTKTARNVLTPAHGAHDENTHMYTPCTPDNGTH